MSEPFIGEIMMFAGNFAIRGWSKCDGALIAINQYQALFSLLGTTYGGDGRTTFALPDLRGRIPVHEGQGPGLPNYVLGRKSGSETVSISNANQVPAHTHSLLTSDETADDAIATGKMLGEATADVYVSSTPNKTMNSGIVGASSGTGQPHSNLMPFKCLNFIIAMTGIFPSR